MSAYFHLDNYEILLIILLTYVIYKLILFVRSQLLISPERLEKCRYILITGCDSGFGRLLAEKLDRSVFLSFCSFIHSFIHPPIHLSVHSSIRSNPPVHLSVHPSIRPSINSSIAFIHPSIHPPTLPSTIHRSIFPSIHLSIPDP